MATPPTVTKTSDTGSTTISGATRTTGANNGTAFTYLSATYSNAGTIGSYTNCYRQDHLTIAGGPTEQIRYLLRFELETDADQIEFLVRSESTTTSRYRIWVDGEKVAADPILVGTSGTFYRIKVNFGSSATRRITFEGQELTFGGIYKIPTRTLWPTSRDVGPKAVAIGDSYSIMYTESDLSMTFWVWDNWAMVLGRHLNWNVYPSAISGTGYTANASQNPTTEVKYADRLTDYTYCNPDIIIVSGGLNDVNWGNSANATDVNNFYAAIKSSLPNTEVFALAPYNPGTYVADFSSDLATLAGYISTAASTNGYTYISGPLTYIAGSSQFTSPDGSGNTDYYSDGFHVNLAGLSYYGRRLASDIANTARNMWSVKRGNTISAGKKGLVPAPSASPSSAKYLTESGTWVQRGKSYFRSTDYSIGKILTPETDVYRWYNKTGQTLTIDRVWVSFATASTATFDINVNGNSIFSSTKLVLSSATVAVQTSAAFSTTTITDGQWITIDVDSVSGSPQYGVVSIDFSVA